MAKESSPFVFSSFRGGLNLYDPPIALSQDQVVEATNVEWAGATLGDRRMGHTAITLPASVTALTGVWKMHRHLPSSDESAAQLWVLAATPNTSAILSYKSDASWTDVALIDTPTTTTAALPLYRFQTLHGKLFVTYPSASDRLHVWTGTTFRRAGLAQPAAAPSLANAGAGSYAGKRYFRVRFLEMSGTSILRRSEPSESASIIPVGTGSAVRITKPAAVSEGETHWEVEASLNNSVFYMVSRQVVGTTTYDDTTAFGTGYGAFTQSEDIGDYTLIPSGKYLIADEDRLLILGSWSDATKASRVQWTPPQKDPGFGSDERLKLSFDPFLDLNGYEGGEITGGCPGNGVIYVFKWSHVYRLARTGNPSQAYQAYPVSKTVGAIPGSIIEGLDNQGNPAIYFVDRIVGPCMIGTGGLIKLVRDIKPLWDTHESTTALEAHGVYYPFKRQLRWEFSVSGVSGTSVGIVLHMDEMRLTQEGGTRGWAKWTGVTGIHDMILYPDNVESGSARTTNLKPLVALSGAAGHHILQADTGTTDDSTAYTAALTTRPVMLGGGINNFGIRASSLIGTANVSATVNLSAIRDFGKETTKTVDSISLAAASTETYVVPAQDNFFGSECRAFQARIADPSPATGTWHLHQLNLIPRAEQTK